MSETADPTAQAGQPMPPLVVNVQYIKDLSFEVPNAPEIYATLRSQPQVSINLDVQARALQDGQNVYEVVLAVKAEAREAVQNGGEGRPVFIAELQYAGVFTLNGVPTESVEPLLLIECPRCFFPSPGPCYQMSRAKAVSRPFCCSRSISSAFGRAVAKRPRPRRTDHHTPPQKLCGWRYSHCTCSIEFAPEAIIANRSKPRAIPDARGMPCSSAAKKSSSIAQSSP